MIISPVSCRCVGEHSYHYAEGSSVLREEVTGNYTASGNKKVILPHCGTCRTVNTIYMIRVKLREAMDAYRQRTGKKLTYELLAEQTGIALTTLQSLARPGYNTRLSTIEKLCVALECSPSDLSKCPKIKSHTLAGLGVQKSEKMSTFFSSIRLAKAFELLRGDAVGEECDHVLDPALKCLEHAPQGSWDASR